MGNWCWLGKHGLEIIKQVSCDVDTYHLLFGSRDVERRDMSRSDASFVEKVKERSPVVPSLLVIVLIAIELGTLQLCTAQ